MSDEKGKLGKFSVKSFRLHRENWNSFYFSRQFFVFDKSEGWRRKVIWGN
jgi:hypothetical protein